MELPGHPRYHVKREVITAPFLSGDEADVATAVESEIALNGQMRATEFEDRVLAMKAKGSDGVMAGMEE